MSAVMGWIWRVLVHRLNRRGMRVIVEGPFRPNPMKDAQPSQHPRRVWEPIGQERGSV